MQIRHLTLRATLASFALCAAVSGHAQPGAAFPSAPIKYVVPAPPGGLIDTMARLVGTSTTGAFKQPVIVDNKPGANTVLGADFVAKAPPDGQTWLAVSITLAANASLPGVTFKPEKSLVPVARLATTPMGFAVPANSPYKSVADLVQASKAGTTLNFGSSGYGTPSHLALALFQGVASINANHIPYKGGAPALTDLIGGQLDATIVTISEAQQFIKAGKLKLLAITGEKRLADFPNVPTTAEAGYPGVLMTGWTGIMVPAGTPAEVVNKIADTVLTAAQQPEFVKRAESLGFVMGPQRPAEFSKFFQDEVTRLGQLIKSQNVRME